ncbi:MAG: hypothetical protein J07HQW2_00732 [Haloquadratum walsbyi J07HQW2]|uniref:Uncharacterized protein n=1 Tax=Haloquadratum walsbyi J07HQW2 TaxID=1238425 RepID=U1NC90_9EURY|nr:MAG: hypothetical protein J07HQW2_00732 [Haloquadratum walsbyi J07HQW2]
MRVLAVATDGGGDCNRVSWLAVGKGEGGAPLQRYRIMPREDI